jgi:hypothetical protein
VGHRGINASTIVERERKKITRRLGCNFKVGNTEISAQMRIVNTPARDYDANTF